MLRLRRQTRELRQQLRAWARYLVLRLQLWWYRGEIQVDAAWRSYEIGFTGNGPTAFDTKPSVPRPVLPMPLREEIARFWNIEGRARRQAWAESCREVLGEEPWEL